MALASDQPPKYQACYRHSAYALWRSSVVVNRPSRTVTPRLQRARGEARKQLDTLPVPCALPPEPEIGRQFLCGLIPVCAHLPDSARHCCAAAQAVSQTLCAFRPPWKERRVGQVNGCRYPASPRSVPDSGTGQGGLGNEGQSRAGGDQFGEVLLGVGGDQDRRHVGARIRSGEAARRRSKPLSSPRSMSTSVTSGRRFSTHCSPSAEELATATTLIP